MNKVKKNLLTLVASALTKCTVFTVNSACAAMLGQDEEPKSLKRFKNH